MEITGDLLVGSQVTRGLEGELRAVNPATGAELEPVFSGGTADDVDRACILAATAFDA